MHRARLACLLLTLPLATPVAAQTIHKCRDADGVLSYQDRPCGTAEERLPAPVIAPPPAYTPPVPEMPRTNAPPVPVDDAVADAPPPPLPAYFHCTIYDGKTYVSQNPNPPPRNVPLVALDFAGADRYEPGDITRGGSLKETTIPRADPYVTVYDQCRRMGARELCGYWKQQFEETRGKRKLAFNDTRPQLEQQEASLRGQLATYCGG